MSNRDENLREILAEVKVAGFPGASIWRMGGNLQAVGVNFYDGGEGADAHGLICDYASESGEWSALLCLDEYGSGEDITIDSVESESVAVLILALVKWRIARSKKPSVSCYGCREEIPLDGSGGQLTELTGALYELLVARNDAKLASRKGSIYCDPCILGLVKALL
jgi:hypothetical protein